MKCTCGYEYCSSSSSSGSLYIYIWTLTPKRLRRDKYFCIACYNIAPNSKQPHAIQVGVNINIKYKNDNAYSKRAVVVCGRLCQPSIR